MFLGTAVFASNGNQIIGSERANYDKAINEIQTPLEGNRCLSFQACGHLVVVCYSSTPGFAQVISDVAELSAEACSDNCEWGDC